MNAPSGVGKTAVLVAAARERESLRADHLFVDPWAHAFVEASGWIPQHEAADEPRDDQLTLWMAARTRFLDDFVLDAVRGGCTQVAILGAGLDTRALRLDWPAPVTIFEVDTAPMLEFKRSVLGAAQPEATVTRVTLPVDLRTDWPDVLRRAEFHDDHPTAWVLEGLLMYLTPQDVDVLMTRIAAMSAPGSRLGATLTSSHFLEDAQTLPQLPDSPIDRDEWRELLRSNGPDDPTRWLDRYGWRGEVFPTADLARKYGRTPPPLDESSHQGDRWMVSATRG
ncbi:SAM-dependent methyltransferase [Rhodococcus sp. D2-41]|uniref:S-adenosyl-L-methionine-dependent methyltransferase n=1 Tax=Speluncibacter jeojiensis TaxID=2710754 RepID=A0A9X4M144_9ACTN|nr:SAM-dependent methyltransferase [Rhodococcus sp. D2-41]MDG3012195.1 SAM-dependent methyltransferase [Rhodococcus sp. D2-41]MDG3014837.1 SAM-dependent methyltransferase [Corynebacteriales bacterium D3-21]